MKSSLQKKQI